QQAEDFITIPTQEILENSLNIWTDGSCLIDRMNDLINLRIGSQKSFVKNLNFNSSNRAKIDFYFSKKEQIDNSDTAQDSYLNEFF
ncbi:13874_t:CDS:2, partial [Cetraspora pellucida]